jgi:signal transduction histidine kinase
LSLCKKIVEFHGGHIWVASDAQEGTTIRWTIPTTTETATVTTQPPHTLEERKVDSR